MPLVRSEYLTGLPSVARDTPVPALVAVTRLGFVPILDVARATVAGFQACPQLDTAGDHGMRTPSSDEPVPDGAQTARTIRQVVAAVPALPGDTFVTLPVDARVAADAAVRAALGARGDLGGLVLDLLGPTAAVPPGELDVALTDYRRAGAVLAIGGHGAAQPELAAIVRFRPAIIRLGRDWVRGIDTSPAKRSAVDLICRLAAQVDAWVLAEDVHDSSELHALAELGVPLAQGSVVDSVVAHGPVPRIG